MYGTVSTGNTAKDHAIRKHESWEKIEGDSGNPVAFIQDAGTHYRKQKRDTIKKIFHGIEGPVNVEKKGSNEWT